MSSTDPSFYTTGGSLRLNTPSYVERRADQELFEALLGGEFCYVLTSRQMGKSSLMVRTAARLRKTGVKVAVLDLTAIGQNVTAEQWYRGLLSRLGEQLDLEDELDDFYADNPQFGPLQRFISALRKVVLPSLSVGCKVSGVQEEAGVRGQGSGVREEGPGTKLQDADGPNPGRQDARTPEHLPLVIFIDEIDAVRSLPFSTDEFFAAIRECFNRRTEESILECLTFCLLGVATPSDLIRDVRTTPFNIGRRIELTDFTEAEAAQLGRGLDDGSEEPKRPTGRVRRLLQRILYWTGGHPYLTQRLCREVSERMKQGQEDSARRMKDEAEAFLHPSAVDRVCEEMFLSSQAREQEDNLLFVRDRLLKSDLDRSALLDLYATIRAGGRVSPDDTNPLLDVLRLSGIVRAEAGRLWVRNRIYEQVFDRGWIVAHMPDAELRRQRAAYRRGLVRASGMAAVIVVVMGALAGAALQQAHRADRNAVAAAENAWRADKNAVRAAEERRQALQSANQARAAQSRSTRLAEQRRQALQQALFQADRANRQATLATAARNDAVQQKQIAEASTEESRERRIRNNVAAGEHAVDSGDAVGALAFYAEALSLDRGNAARQEVHRTRLASILQRTPPLRRMWFHNGMVNSAVFDSSGRRVLTAATDGKARVWEVASGRLLQQIECQEPVNSAVFSPDGRRILTACGAGVAHRSQANFRTNSRQPGTARVWDAATGKPLSPPFRHGGAVNLARFSPDGRRIVTASEDGTARVWDLSKGTAVTMVVGMPVWTASFSPRDGRWIATSNADGPVQVWDSTTGQPVSSPMADGGSLDVTFSPDGSRVLTADMSWQARVWEVPSGRDLNLHLPHMDFVWCAAFSPNGQRIATGGMDGVARVWDAANGRYLTPPLRHNGTVRSVTFDSSGTRLLTASDDRTVLVWDVESGLPITPPLPHAGPVGNATFGPDGQSVLTASSDGTARLYDLGPARPISVPYANGSWIAGVAFSPDGKQALSFGGDNRAQIRDPATLRPLRPAIDHGDAVFSSEFSQDGKKLLTGGQDGRFRVWDLLSGRVTTPQFQHWGVIEHAHFSPDGRRVVTASRDNTAAVWSAETGKRLAVFRHAGFVSEARFSPDGKRVVTASYDRSARVWDAESGKEVRRPLWHRDIVCTASFSPDGRRILTASDDGTARIWDAAKGDTALHFLKHSSGVLEAVFSPDGRRVATASTDVTARIWDAETGKPVTSSLKHGGVVFMAVFSRDGRRLMTASKDRTVRLWDTQTGEELMPPIIHTRPLTGAALSPDGRRVLTATGGTGELFTWEIPSTDRPVRDLLLEAQLLSGQRVDASGALIRLETEAVGEAWTTLQRQYGDALFPSVASSSYPSGLAVNGSFESGPDPGAWKAYPQGSEEIIGWTVSRGSVDVIGNWLGSHGRRILDLDGNSAEALRQELSTVPGRRYQVAFDLGGNPFGGSVVKRLRVSAAGHAAEFTFDTTGSSPGAMNWQRKRWEFTAAASSTVVEFSSLDQPDSTCGPILDAVSVTLVPARKAAKGSRAQRP